MLQRRALASGSTDALCSVLAASPKEHAKHPRAPGRTRQLSLLLLALVSLTVAYPRLAAWLDGGGAGTQAAGEPPLGPVLVSYSYFEKDPVQVGAGLAPAARAGLSPALRPATAAARRATAASARGAAPTAAAAPPSARPNPAPPAHGCCAAARQL